MDSLSKLKSLWDQEKEHYRKIEIGSGVQSFVKKVLESEIFNLIEGKLSTRLEYRHNEFIYEKKAKEKRKADFYIYINSEIAIPTEVECYGNIKAGEKQLLNYQKDFEKHYGILTDGFEWRFYNNNIYKTFSLEDIFHKSGVFLTFWKEYIKPEFYYLSFFERTGQLALIEEAKLGVEDNRLLFFEDITKLIQSFKNKLQIEGYLEEAVNKTREKRAIELTYAYVIQFILYKTLVDNDFDDFANEFDSTVTKIHESLKNRRYKDILGIIEGISVKISKNVYRPFIKEQEFIKDKIQDLYHSLENNLSDVSPWLDIFIFIKKYNYSNVRNEIFGYIYENYLKELYEETKKGQYFTDPTVVNFMLDQIGYTPEVVTKRVANDPDSVSIIDPSCGSGTFLYSATDSIVKAFLNGGNEEASKKIEEIVTSCVFGLDIEEFPLYLAEMNVLMRMLPLIINEKYNNPIDKKIKVFKTRDSISEFMDTALKNTLSDINIAFVKNKGQTSLFAEKLNLGYSSYVRDEDDLQEMKKSLENQPEVPRRRFDYVIGNPPYIPYNECSRERVMIVKLIQEKRASMGDIYGVNLNTVPGRIKAYSPKPNLYAFFIALGIALLKDDGKLCYIVPQTLLFANDLDVIRFHLSKYTTIEKIITFNSPIFLGRGLKQKNTVATSSMIFILSKKPPSLDSYVQIVDYKGAGHDADDTFKKITEKKIRQQDLLVNVSNWNFIKQDRSYIDFYETYKENSEDISIYRAKLNPDQDFSFDGGVIINSNHISNVYVTESFEIFDYKHNNWELYSVGKGRLYYPNTSPIKFPEGSQGIGTFMKRYKVIWRTRFTNNFQFTDRNILLINNQSLLVSSNSESELLYLFALLNSKLNKLILEKNLKQENEKNYLVPLRAVKSYIRMPSVVDRNTHLKPEVIDLSKKLLNLEKGIIESYVDFTGVLKQKFDNVKVEDDKLILEKDEEKIKLPIGKEAQSVRKAIEAHYGLEGFPLGGESFTLSELKSLPVIDFYKQKELKSFIDDLVYCLYFNIGVPEDKISDSNFVKSLCQKNEYYKLVSGESRPIKE